jgi:hypothetical protein
MPEVLFSRRTDRKTAMCKMSWDNTGRISNPKVVNADKNGANVTPAKLALNLKKELKK